MAKARFLVTVAAALGGAIMTASAADLPPVKAPMFAPVAAAYDWSGWYGGVGVGGLWGDSNYLYPLDPARAAGGYSVPFEQAMAGAFGGYQWHFKAWHNGGIVVGMEYGGSANLSEYQNGTDCTPAAGVALTCQTRMENLFTIGGKLGFTWDRFMLYGSGGWAGAIVNTRETDTATGAGVNLTRAWHSGWYAGGGIDYVFYQTKGSDWIFGVEYQHVDLSDTLRHFVETVPAAGIATRDVDLTADVVRAKLTVKLNGPYGLFGGGTGPVVARY